MQNNGKEMYKKSVLHVVVVFHHSLALPSPFSITQFYILFEQTINTIESLAKSIVSCHLYSSFRSVNSYQPTVSFYFTVLHFSAYYSGVAQTE